MMILCKVFSLGGLEFLAQINKHLNQFAYIFSNLLIAFIYNPYDQSIFGYIIILLLHVQYLSSTCATLCHLGRNHQDQTKQRNMACYSMACHHAEKKTSTMLQNVNWTWKQMSVT